MKNVFTIGFGMLMLLSALVWVAGIFAGAIVPLFGGIRAEHIGAIGFSVGMLGESCVYLFGWLHKRASQSGEQFTGFRGPKRYGHKIVEPSGRDEPPPR
jgi:hypothetical protein